MPKGLCDIFVLNVHAQTEDKCDDTKESCHVQLDRALDQAPMCRMATGLTHTQQ
jgi:hypothetical protein